MAAGLHRGRFLVLPRIVELGTRPDPEVRSGIDKLPGGKDNDVLIGGDIDEDEFDGDDTLLMDALTAWISEDLCDDRVMAVDNLLAVIDDEDRDTLTGSSDGDLFYGGLGDNLTDFGSDDNDVLK